LCELMHSPLIPAPSRIFLALIDIGSDPDFPDHLFASLFFTIKAMMISIFITMLIVYSSTIPAFRPIALFVSKLRYLTLTGLIFLFIFLSGGNIADVKLNLLIFGIVPFFVTSFYAVVRDIPQQQIDKAFVNKLNRWETLWRVVVVGKAESLWEVMKQNFAISWLMITMVEGQAMNEGGVGTLIIRGNKTFQMPYVLALLVIVLVLGIVFDIALSKARLFLYRHLPKKR
ncbi:MAG TPA: hypothetical protein VEC37_19055, partial [Bacillota bacterium]|nr:hypothetical protein [Bacillota bacterium]